MKNKTKFYMLHDFLFWRICEVFIVYERLLVEVYFSEANHFGCVQL